MGRDRTILIVDEMQWFRDLGALFLARSGRVLAAGSAAEALETARRERPDVVITDLDMPVCDGAELCARIRRDALLAYTPVVVLIGTDDPEDHARAIRAGATDVLTKPLSRTSLLESVGRLTRHARPVGRPRVDTAEPVQLRVAGEASEGTLRNLSRGGAFVELPEPLPSGPEVELAFRIPGSTRAIAPSAEVVWTRPAAHGARRFGQGLRFLRLDARALRALEDYVFEHTEKSPTLPATA
ncbi:MAG: response regulator [Myxococcales bacterium]|nr:response regulator [Myxococcales bacterium]